MITLTPYTIHDGIPTYRDSEVAGFYDRIIAEGYSYIFDGSSIQDASGFVREMKRSLMFVACLDQRPVAVCWLNRFEGDMARIHFCTFKAIGKRALDVGRYAIAELFRKTLFNAFIGSTPASNPMAIEYIVRVGGKVVGRLPLETEEIITFFGRNEWK